MADKEVKIRVTTDHTPATEGFKKVEQGAATMETRLSSITARIKQNWLGITAALTGIGYAAKKAFDLMGAAADYQERISVIAQLGAQYQMTGQQIVTSMTDAARGMISWAEAADMAAKSLNIGFSPEQMAELTSAAETLSDAVGGSIPEAYDRMAVAIAKGRVTSLAEMGIIVDLDDAYEKYATTHGKIANQLSKTEEMHARLNAVVQEAKERQDALGGGVDSVRDKMDRWIATINNLKIVLGTGLMRVGAGIIGVFQGISSASLLVSAGVWKIIQGYRALQAFVSSGEWKKYYESQSEIAKANASADWSASQKYANNANNNFKFMISGPADQVSSYKSGKTSKADEIAQTAVKAATKAAEIQKVTYTDSYAEITRLQERYREFMARESIETMDRWQHEAAEIVNIAEEKNKDIEKLLDAGAISFEDAMKAWELIAQNTAIKLKEVIGTPSEGWASGIKKWTEENIKPEFQQMEELAQTTASSMRDSLSNLFFDAAKGDMSDFRSYMSSFLDDILKKVTDTLASMVTKWIMSQAEMAAASGEGILGSLFGFIGDAFEWILSAKGNIFNNGQLVPYGMGGVVTRPTVFPMATGAGLMGEKGPEAIMPLARNQRGELGVKSNGSGKSEGGNTNITIVALDSRSFEDYARRNAHVFRNVITQGLRDYKMNAEWKALLNVR